MNCRSMAAAASPPREEAGERFVHIRHGTLSTVRRVTPEHRREWLGRRLINTLLVVPCMYRLVFPRDRLGVCDNMVFG